MKYRRSDQRTILLIFIIILAIWTGVLIERWIFAPSSDSLQSLDQATMDTLSGKGLRTAEERVDKKPYAQASDAETVIETFPFDPNTADSISLLRLGLAPWQVRSIYTYRSRGGRYHRVEDFKRVPGMTPEIYERLAPYIRIGRAFRYYDESDFRSDSIRKGRREHSDTIQSETYQEKFRELTLVDINEADTALLKRIPGIGSYRARQIVSYRERLGGFTDVQQLYEIKGFPAAQLSEWFKVGKGVFHRINVNTATFTEMGHHPYIGFTRARAIDSYRRNYGTIHDLSELSLLPDFTDDVIERLRPYVQY